MWSYCYGIITLRSYRTACYVSRQSNGLAQRFTLYTWVDSMWRYGNYRVESPWSFKVALCSRENSQTKKYCVTNWSAHCYCYQRLKALWMTTSALSCITSHRGLVVRGYLGITIGWSHGVTRNDSRSSYFYVLCRYLSFCYNGMYVVCVRM